LVLWAYVFGGQWYDPQTGEVTANHPRNVAALRWLASYGHRYDVRRMQSFESTLGRATTANAPFFVGKAAMWQTGEWAEDHIRRFAPGMEWGWFPYPAPPGGRPDTTLASGSVFAIPAAAPHPDAAWGYLDWLPRPAQVASFCAAIHNLPPLRMEMIEGDGGRQTKDGGRRTADEGRRTADEGRRTMDDGRWTMNDGTGPPSSV